MRKLLTIPGLLLVSLAVLAASCEIPPGCSPEHPELCIPPPVPSGPYDCDASSAARLTLAEARPFAASSSGRYIVRRTGPTPRGIAQLQGAYSSMSNTVPLNIINGFAANLSAEDAERLHAEPGFVVEQDGEKRIPTPIPPTPGARRAIGPAASTRIVNLDRLDQVDLPLDGDYAQPVDASDIEFFVVDTGICETHPDFTGRIGEGFSSQGGTEHDQHGHGCHVSGTILGGQFGAANGGTLHGVRVLNAQGSGSDSQVIQGIDWVVNYVTEHGLAGKAVANFSLGGDTSDALDAAMCRMIAAGVEVAVAAGNDGLDACKYSPARIKQALTVGAANPRNDQIASFSNVGQCVDVFGDGVDITSARLGGGETVFSGTSMASPQGAGSLGLMLKLEPGADAKAKLLALASEDKIRGDIGSSPNLRLFVGRE